MSIRMFRKHGNSIVEKVKVTDPTSPEFVIDNPHSKDYGKMRKDTVEYRTKEELYKQKAEDAKAKVESVVSMSPVEKVMANAEKQAAIKQVERVADENKQNALIAKLQGNKEYMEKVSLADMSSEKAMLAKMALIDSEQEYQKSLNNTLITPEQHQEMAFNAKSKTTGPVYHLVKDTCRYFISYDTVGTGGRAYVKPENVPGAIPMSGINKWVVLTHRPSFSELGGNPNIVSNQRGRDLTKAEVLSILEVKPSFKELCAGYWLSENRNTQIDISVVTPIF